MSTDIVQFQSHGNGPPRKVYSSAALILFLEISLPLMAVTFVVWLVVYAYLNWRQKLDEEKRAVDSAV